MIHPKLGWTVVCLVALPIACMRAPSSSPAAAVFAGMFATASLRLFAQKTSTVFTEYCFWRYRPMNTFRLLLPLAVTLAACSKEENSDQISTNQIEVTYQAEISDHSDDAQAPHLIAFFRKAEESLDLRTTDVRLADGDLLFGIVDGGAEHPILRNSVGFYDVDLEQSISNVRFDLRRANQVPAPNSVVDLPPRLAFTAPTPGASIAVGANVDLAWGNPISGATIRISPEPCDGASTVLLDAIADVGSTSIAAQRLVVGAPAPGGSCVELTITREVKGTVDSAFSPKSTIVGSRVQFRAVRLTITP